MKLTAENIAAIEALLTMHSEVGGRATVIEFNLPGLSELSSFVGVARRLGVNVPRARHSRRMADAEKRVAAMWLAGNRAVRAV